MKLLMIFSSVNLAMTLASSDLSKILNWNDQSNYKRYTETAERPISQNIKVPMYVMFKS